MKILAYYPTNGSSITVDITPKEEQRLYGKKIGEQFDGAIIGEQFSGCIVQIKGGNDYQGVCMVANKDTTKKIRVLLAKGDTGYRARQAHIKKRKTVRGSVVSSSIQVISVVVVQIPEGREIAGLTDVIREKSHLPKRAEKIRALFGLPADCMNIQEEVSKLILANNPEAKVPRLKITGIISEEKKAAIAKKTAMRLAKKERFAREKAEYEAKYGKAI